MKFQEYFQDTILWDSLMSHMGMPEFNACVPSWFIIIINCVPTTHPGSAFGSLFAASSAAVIYKENFLSGFTENLLNFTEL